MWLAVLVLAFAPEAWGGVQVLWREPQDSKFEYAARLKAEADATSPSKAYRNLFPKSAARQELAQQFAEAQKRFLDQNSNLAVEKFADMANQMSQQDWGRIDRSLLALALMRLAQLELDLEKQDAWLTKVILLGDFRLNRNLFPPPLSVRLDRLRAQFPWRKDMVEAIKDGWSEILINGNPCHIESCAAWPDISEKVRVTFLSDQWKPVTEMLLVREIAKYTPQRLAWSDQDCAEFFEAKCSSRSLRARVGLRPMSYGEAGAAGGAGSSADSSLSSVQFPTTPGKASPSMLKNKWLWIGVGALTAAVIIHQSQDKKTERQPTTTYGF